VVTELRCLQQKENKNERIEKLTSARSDVNLFQGSCFAEASLCTTHGRFSFTVH